MSTPEQHHDPLARVTVLGSRRNADLVVPTDLPVAALVPQLLDLLGEPRGVARYELVGDLDTVLDPEAPLRESGVVDGARLRLVATGEVPPSPLVHDLVDLVDQSLPRGRWDTSGRAWSLSAAASAILGAAAVLASRAPGASTAVVAGAAAVVLLVVCAAVATRSRPAGWATGAAGVLAAAAGAASWGAGRPLVWLPVAAAVLWVAGWCTRQARPAAGAAGLLVLCTATAVGVHALDGDRARTAGVVGTLALLLLGLAPRAALVLSGVLRVDAEVAADRPVPVRDARAAIVRAHGALLLAVLTLAVVLGLALGVLGAAGAGSPWTAALTVLLALAAVLRARHLPLATQRVALWAAAGSGLLALLLAVVRERPGVAWPAVGVCALLGAALLAGALVRPGEVQAARARRVAGRLEAVVVLAVLPVLVGCFDVYAQLLRTF